MQLSKNHEYSRHSGLSVKLNKCENSIKNIWGLINDSFIYLACVMDFNVRKKITWTIAMRSNGNNKFNHKSTEMNAFCIFSDF